MSARMPGRSQPFGVPSSGSDGLFPTEPLDAGQEVSTHQHFAHSFPGAMEPHRLGMLMHDPTSAPMGVHHTMHHARASPSPGLSGSHDPADHADPMDDPLMMIPFWDSPKHCSMPGLLEQDPPLACLGGPQMSSQALANGEDYSEPSDSEPAARTMSLNRRSPAPASYGMPSTSAPLKRVNSQTKQFADDLHLLQTQSSGGWHGGPNRAVGAAGAHPSSGGPVHHVSAPMMFQHQTTSGFNPIALPVEGMRQSASHLPAMSQHLKFAPVVLPVDESYGAGGAAGARPGAMSASRMSGPQSGSGNLTGMMDGSEFGASEIVLLSCDPKVRLQQLEQLHKQLNVGRDVGSLPMQIPAGPQDPNGLQRYASAPFPNTLSRQSAPTRTCTPDRAYSNGCSDGYAMGSSVDGPGGSLHGGNLSGHALHRSASDAYGLSSSIGYPVGSHGGAGPPHPSARAPAGVPMLPCSTDAGFLSTDCEERTRRGAHAMHMLRQRSQGARQVGMSTNPHRGQVLRATPSGPERAGEGSRGKRKNEQHTTLHDKVVAATGPTGSDVVGTADSSLHESSKRTRTSTAGGCFALSIGEGSVGGSLHTRLTGQMDHVRLGDGSVHPRPSQMLPGEQAKEERSVEDWVALICSEETNGDKAEAAGLQEEFLAWENLSKSAPNGKWRGANSRKWGKVGIEMRLTGSVPRSSGPATALGCMVCRFVDIVGSCLRSANSAPGCIGVEDVADTHAQGLAGNENVVAVPEQFVWKPIVVTDKNSSQSKTVLKEKVWLGTYHTQINAAVHHDIFKVALAVEGCIFTSSDVRNCIQPSGKKTHKLKLNFPLDELPSLSYKAVKFSQLWNAYKHETDRYIFKKQTPEEVHRLVQDLITNHCGELRKHIAKIDSDTSAAGPSERPQRSTRARRTSAAQVHPESPLTEQGE